MADSGGGGSLDGWIPMSGGDSDVDDGWIPTTDLGRQVKAGEIRSLEEIHIRSLPVEEHQIMDKLFGSSLEKLAMVQEYQTNARNYKTAGKPHTLPCKIRGECKSVIVVMEPAPRGVGIVSEVSMRKVLLGVLEESMKKKVIIDKVLEASMNKVLELAGIDDVLTSCWGSRNTLENLVTATYECLKENFSFLPPYSTMPFYRNML